MSDEILPDPDRQHRYSLMINWSDTNNAYLVSIPELNAKTHGETLQEAVEMAKDLIECYVQNPPLLDPLPEPLLYDDRTNFAPDPFEKVAGLRESLEETGQWSDENPHDDASTSERAKETADA